MSTVERIRRTAVAPAVMRGLVTQRMGMLAAICAAFLSLAGCLTNGPKASGAALERADVAT
ncbi:MAG: hypothetical protein AB7S62_13195, partial [Azoarcus sp.]